MDAPARHVRADVPPPRRQRPRCCQRRGGFDFCAGGVAKKEVGLRLARKGFAEESANFWSGVARTKRRVYRLNFPDSAGAHVALHARPGSTGGS